MRLDDLEWEYSDIWEDAHVRDAHGRLVCTIHRKLGEGNKFADAGHYCIRNNTRNHNNLCPLMAQAILYHLLSLTTEVTNDQAA
jgi:hypothetical protein